jgi:hypothetical protein
MHKLLHEAFGGELNAPSSPIHDALLYEAPDRRCQKGAESECQILLH